MFFPHPPKVKETALFGTNRNNFLAYSKLLQVTALVLPGIGYTSYTWRHGILEVGQALLLFHCYRNQTKITSDVGVNSRYLINGNY